MKKFYNLGAWISILITLISPFSVFRDNLEKCFKFVSFFDENLCKQTVLCSL